MSGLSVQKSSGADTELEGLKGLLVVLVVLVGGSECFARGIWGHAAGAIGAADEPVDSLSEGERFWLDGLG